MINLLPKWKLPEVFTSLYDHESATSIEMTSKLYGAVQELIKDYNEFVEKIKISVKEFEDGTTKDYNAFKIAMSQLFENFINTVELKIKSQDKEINDSIKYIKNNLNSVASNLIKTMYENGEFNDAVLTAIEDFKTDVNDVNNRLDEILLELENNGLLIQINEEEKTLVVGVDIMPNETINFTYMSDKGYSLTTYRNVDGSTSFDVKKISPSISGIVTTKNGSITIGENVTKIKVEGITCILIPPIRDALIEFQKKLNEAINDLINTCEVVTHTLVDNDNVLIKIISNNVMATLIIDGTFNFAGENYSYLCAIPDELRPLNAIPFLENNGVSFDFMEEIYNEDESNEYTEYVIKYHSNDDDVKVYLTCDYPLKNIPIMNTGTGEVSTNQVELVDRTTGDSYHVYIDNGELLLERVV